MKQRLKGLLALVLSLTMVLGLMTCAWGVEYKIYVDYSSGSEVYKLGVSDGNGGYTEKNPDLFNVNDSVTNSNGSGSVLVFDGEKFAPVGTEGVYKESDPNNAIDGLASFKTFSANEKYIYRGVGLAEKDGEILVSLDWGSSYEIPYIYLVPACTVTFDLQGYGTMTTATQTDIPKGETVDEPVVSDVDGWIFGGWYKEAACTNAYNFNTRVTADITLYAKWEKEENTYTVTFDANGHGTAPSAQSGIAAGGKVVEPADPTADGWTFGGWYREEECTNKWDFAADTVEANITLYAQWTENSNGEDPEQEPPVNPGMPYFPPKKPEVESANTFDGGIASAVVVTILSATGSAWLAKKKD